MTRRRPVNPWQEATALGGRLRVRATSTIAPRGVEWTHPDLSLTYRLNEAGEWALVDTTEGPERVIAFGVMTGYAAALYIDTARTAEARRLAAAAMLKGRAGS